MEEKQSVFMYKFLKVIYKFLLRILFLPQVEGLENIPEDGRVIFAGNHIHAVDPTVLMSKTKRIVHFMAKKDLFKGIHGKVLKKIGLIPVYRDRANPVAVIHAEEILNNGGTIGIFPESTRNKTNQELLPFRKGAVSIAKKTNTKIVPFAIKGKYKLFRKGITLKIGKPIDLANMEVKEGNEYLRNEVLKLLRG